MTTDKKVKQKKQGPSKPAPAAAKSSKNVKSAKSTPAVKPPKKTAGAKSSIPAKTPTVSPAPKPAKKRTAAPAVTVPTEAAPAVTEPIVLPAAASEAVPPTAEQAPASADMTIVESAPAAPETEQSAAAETELVAAAAVPDEKPIVKKGKKSAAIPAPTAAAEPAVVNPPAEVKPAAEPKPVKHLVCLLGDEVLVKEYSAMFQERGISVLELKSLSSLKNSAKKITAAFELTLVSGELKSKNLLALDEALSDNVPVATCSVTSTVLVQTHGLKHRHRFVGISAFPTLTENSLMELAPSLHTTKAAADGITELLGQAKKETAMVQDGVGMVMPRILCQIVNEALFTVQNDVASPHDIDEAMKHGTNYPHGPIAWGERIGFATVVSVLDALYENHHEERYRVAPLLRQLAVAGVFWEREKA